MIVLAETKTDEMIKMGLSSYNPLMFGHLASKSGVARLLYYIIYVEINEF